MKNSWLFLLFIVCATTQMQAQFSIGATGGLNFSDTKLKNLPNNFKINREQVIYQYFGVIPKYQFAEKFSLSCNVEFSQKGFEEKYFGLNSAENSFKFRTNYLDFIPKLEYHPIKAISFGIGMFFGVNIGEKLSSNDGDWQEPVIDINQDTDIGLSSSIRGNFHNFFVMISYNYGLKNVGGLIFTDINGEPLLDSKQVSRNLQVGVGYFFDFKNG